MENSEDDLDQENKSSALPHGKKCQAGTLLHYFQKKSHPAEPPTLEVKCDESTKKPIHTAEGSEKQNSGSSSTKESKDIQLVSCETSSSGTTEDIDTTQIQKCVNRSSGKKKKPVSSSDQSCQKNGEIKEPVKVSERKRNGDCGTNSSLSHSTKKPSRNPFQILMESGKKKGVWDKPTSKAKDPEDLSSEDECVELENEVPARSAGQCGNVKYFSIFSKSNKSSVDTSLTSDAKREASIKEVELNQPAELSKSAAAKRKPTKGVERSSSDANKSLKRKKSGGAAEENPKESKSKKTKDCKSKEDKSSNCSSAVRKSRLNESGDKDDMNVDTAATPRKSRLKVASDSDFEPDDVQRGKRKGRTPSKSQSDNSKRPRTSSLPRVDADSSSKPATLSAAQKLVKKSKNHKRSSDDGSRRVSQQAGTEADPSDGWDEGQQRPAIDRWRPV